MCKEQRLIGSGPNSAGTECNQLNVELVPPEEQRTGLRGALTGEPTNRQKDQN